MKCKNSFCKNEVEEGMGLYCLKCEDLMEDARIDKDDWDIEEED